MKKNITFICFILLSPFNPLQAKPPIYISFLWHMHQPIYFPYESVVATEGKGVYGFSVLQVHLDRTGPYTDWPVTAVESGKNAGLPHLGAQISFTGSLIENLNNIELAGIGFKNWKSRWIQAKSYKTALGNMRVDLVAFPYFHPIIPLIGNGDAILQIELHRAMVEKNLGSEYTKSKGIFPPETSFAEWMIPALKEAGVEWALIDNIHFDRALKDYPYTAGSNLYPPNPADQSNDKGVNWVQLKNIWAPSKVSAPWGYQPHFVEYCDPDMGKCEKIIAVPAARYEGNEDGKGGFGALLYEAVMSQYEDFNTDDKHPMLIVLHHDGDNYGGGVESYYKSNFVNFINWLKENPDRFVATTVQDYLDMFPPDENDVIHVEPGSWSGANNGDPEFLKWNGDPDKDGYSPDRNSWGVLTAAKNRVQTADSISPYTSLDNILKGAGSDTDKAWHFFLVGESSDYWYWDYSQGGLWDSHPTRAANEAVKHADTVIGSVSNEVVPPAIYMPQREPYNPGGYEFKTTKEPSDFVVWTYVYDVSGLQNVALRYRVDYDGAVDYANKIFSGGEWQSAEMTGKYIESKTDPKPLYKASEYSTLVSGYSDCIVDYYVEASDKKGNTAKSPIQHLYIGTKSGSSKLYSPENPTKDDQITVFSEKEGNLHWGVNGWKKPAKEYWTTDTFDFGDGYSVETPMKNGGNGKFSVVIGPFNNPAQEVKEVDFVFHYKDGTWSSPDQKIIIKDTAFAEELKDEIISPDAEYEISVEITEVAEEDKSDDLPDEFIEYFAEDLSEDAISKADGAEKDDLMPADEEVAKETLSDGDDLEIEKKPGWSSGCSVTSFRK